MALPYEEVIAMPCRLGPGTWDQDQGPGPRMGPVTGPGTCFGVRRGPEHIRNMSSLRKLILRAFARNMNFILEAYGKLFENMFGKKLMNPSACF